MVPNCNIIYATFCTIFLFAKDKVSLNLFAISFYNTSFMTLLIVVERFNIGTHPTKTVSSTNE